MNGLIIVDKPLHKTSFDIIRDLRKEYNTRKMGHIGTLDPMATGVLPILVGEATKLSDYLMEHDKEYIAKIYLGEKRDTGDTEGEIIEKLQVPRISKDKIDKVLKSFLGESMQIPPLYSAVKVNGKKLYELARQGKTVERTARKIKIYEIEVIDVKIDEGIIKEIDFRVVCSKGTYIRVLCEDIAKELGTCGYMKSLRRTRVGNFKIEDSGRFIEMKDILIVKNIDICKLKINHDELLKKLINGVSIKLHEKDGLVNLYKDRVFIGIGQVENENLKRKILI